MVKEEVSNESVGSITLPISKTISTLAMPAVVNQRDGAGKEAAQEVRARKRVRG